MKKLIVSMLTLIMAVSLFAGCSRNNDSSNDAGDKIESVIDDTGSLIDKGMNDAGSIIDEGMNDVGSMIDSGMDNVSSAVQ